MSEAKTPVAYIICESDINPNIKDITRDKLTNKPIGEGILQTADELNRNGRFYGKEELFPQLTAPRTVELLEAGYLRAEMGHPLAKDLQRQSTIDDTKTCARFLKLWTEGNDIWADFTPTNNEYGKAFGMDLMEGCKPAWSLRALGSIEQTRRGAEVRNLRLITWDNVIYPSHPGAYTKKVIMKEQANKSFLNESGFAPAVIDYGNDRKGKDLVIPIDNDGVIDFIKSESKNLKFVQECFDFVYESVNVTNNGTKVVLETKDHDTIYVNIESYIHNEITNYLQSRKKYMD